MPVSIQYFYRTIISGCRMQNTQNTAAVQDSLFYRYKLEKLNYQVSLIFFRWLWYFTFQRFIIKRFTNIWPAVIKSKIWTSTLHLSIFIGFAILKYISLELKHWDSVFIIVLFIIVSYLHVPSKNSWTWPLWDARTILITTIIYWITEASINTAIATVSLEMFLTEALLRENEKDTSLCTLVFIAFSIANWLGVR